MFPANLSAMLRVATELHSLANLTAEQLPVALGQRLLQLYATLPPDVAERVTPAMFREALLLAAEQLSTKPEELQAQVHQVASDESPFPPLDAPALAPASGADPLELEHQVREALGLTAEEWAGLEEVERGQRVAQFRQEA